MNRQRKQWIRQVERTLWCAGRQRSPARRVVVTERLVLHGICAACGALAGAGASAVPGAQSSPIGVASRAQV